MTSDSANETLQQHAQRAVVDYLGVRSFYDDLSSVVARIIIESLKKREIKVHSVQHRAKEPDSFARKAAIPLDSDPEAPKYANPLREITDLAGVRVITHFPNTITDVDQLLNDEFEIAEMANKGLELIEEERFGYQSIHYLVKIKADRTCLAEYERFADATVEIQLRTILQHAWAEIEHDIQYKSSNTIPTEIRRRFMSLAGMLEVADREFQAIEDADRALEKRATNLVQTGQQLSDVEITPKALKLLLDRMLGADGRMSDWSYTWTAGTLKKLGFKDLEQVKKAISPYNDHTLSILAEGNRQGQLTRFELMLLAAMGEEFIRRHVWSNYDWFKNRRLLFLERFREGQVVIGSYDPYLDR